MTNFIPIFPLNIVPYPGERLHLHIFEPRYKQLINDCLQSGKPFGIPSVINNSIAEMGTLMQIVEISQVYEDGKMDIKTEGLRVFKLLELVSEIPDKLYGGAIVHYPENNMQGSASLMKTLLSGMRALHAKLDVSKHFSKPDEALNSYDIAHHMGLSLEEEYELLQLLWELQRLEYLKRHLTKVIPMMQEMDALRKKIRQNGHFKNLEGFNFK